MNIAIISSQLIGRDSDKVTNPVLIRLAKFLKIYGVEVNNISFHSSLKFIAYSKFLLWIIHQRLNPKYDRYHVHFGGFVSFIVSLIFPKRVRNTFHGTDLHAGSVEKKGRLKRKFNQWFSIGTILLSKKFSVVSENLLEYVPQRFINNREIFITPSFIDPDAYRIHEKKHAQLTLNLDLNKIYVLFSDISGVSVKRRDIAESIEKMLKELNENIELLLMTGVSHDQVSLYLSASDFLLITSDNEGSPIIVREAIHFSMPVITTDVGDTIGLISDEELCFVLKEDLKIAELLKFIENNVQKTTYYNKNICNKIYPNYVMKIYKELLE